MNKNININGIWNGKSYTVSERRTLVFSSYKNHNLKLWWVGACKTKKEHFLYHSFCLKGIFFKSCTVSQWTVYWIHFQNMHTFTYKKNYLIHFSCLFLKLSKGFSVSWRCYQWIYPCIFLILNLWLILWFSFILLWNRALFCPMADSSKYITFWYFTAFI